MRALILSFFRITLIFGCFTISCKKGDDPDKKDQNEYLYFWDQTKCSDPWGTGENNSNEETSLAVTDFLESEGITVIEVRFDVNSTLDTYCESCGCGTGQRVIVSVAEEDQNRMNRYNFHQ